MVVWFNKDWIPDKIICIRTPTTNAEKIIVDLKDVAIQGEAIDLQTQRIPATQKKAIYHFIALFRELKKTEITRSFRIVGDIGEYYACNQLKLTICMNQNEKGFDAVDDVGKKYEIKTRRIYESSRRVSERRRFNNLAGKSADFVVVVALDREFACAGMWLIPYRNIPDPANSWITMVNDIPGTVSIVRSRIPGLHNRESIKPAVQKVQRKTIPRKKKVMKGTDDQSVLPEPVEKSSQQEDKVPGSSSMSTWWVLFIILALLVLYLIARLQ